MNIDMQVAMISFLPRTGVVLLSHQQVLTKVSDATETYFQHLLLGSKGLSPVNGLVEEVSLAVLSSVRSEVFNELKDHMFDCCPSNNHVFFL